MSKLWTTTRRLDDTHVRCSWRHGRSLLWQVIVNEQSEIVINHGQLLRVNGVDYVMGKIPGEKPQFFEMPLFKAGARP